MIKIRVENLNFSYNKISVLKNVSFSINEKTINILLGLNGSGKTTLIKLMTNILENAKSNIFINGKDIISFSSKDLSKVIAYVPQNIADDNDFLVSDYITFGLLNTIKFYSSPQKENNEKARLVVENMGMQNLLAKKMNELSGGQRQLMVIARAIVQNTDIIILDEPTSALDYKNQELVLHMLEDLRTQGKTIIFSCHNPSVPLLLDSEVLVLENGQLKIQGNARRLLTIDALREIYNCDLICSSQLPYAEISIKPRKM